MKEKPHPIQRKKQNEQLLYDELREYTHGELMMMFARALEEMSVKGILSPKEQKEFLENLKTWLLEEMEN